MYSRWNSIALLSLGIVCLVCLIDEQVFYDTKIPISGLQHTTPQRKQSHAQNSALCPFFDLRVGSIAPRSFSLLGNGRFFISDEQVEFRSHPYRTRALSLLRTSCSLCLIIHVKLPWKQILGPQLHKLRM